MALRSARARAAAVALALGGRWTGAARRQSAAAAAAAAAALPQREAEEAFDSPERPAVPPPRGEERYGAALSAVHASGFVNVDGGRVDDGRYGAFRDSIRCAKKKCA